MDTQHSVKQNEALKADYRDMQPNDMAIVTELMTQLWALDTDGEPMTLDHALLAFNHMFTHPDNGRFIVFEVNTKVVGYSMLVNYYSTPYYGMIWNIEELFVLPEFRKQGIVTLFMDRVKHQACLNKEVVALTIQVLPYNIEAAKLYRKLGFIGQDNEYIWLCNSN